MNRTLFWDRLHTSRLSLWELGDLLGLHPHVLGFRELNALDQQPVRVVVDLARRLDMHPADLVDSIESVLNNHRGTASTDPTAEPTDDALTILTALAAAVAALTIDQLADALGWKLERIQTAMNYAEEHPHLAGPLILRRVPPHGYTVKPRLDRLTAEQHKAVTTSGHAKIMTVEQANAVLAVIALGHRPEYGDWHAEHTDAEQGLRAAGLIYNPYNHEKPKAAPEVLYSLRYDRTGDRDVTDYAPPPAALRSDPSVAC